MCYLPVYLTAFHKLAVSSDSCYSALVKHYYFVGIQYRADTLCNDYYRAIVNIVGECLSQLHICFKIKCGEAVVKQIYLRLFGNCTGDRQTLFLSARNIRTTLGNRLVVFLRLAVDKFRRLRDFCGKSDSFIICIFRTESYIAVYRSREQYAFLRHKACNIMERMLGYISDVGSVYSNAAFGNIKESRYEIYKR